MSPQVPWISAQADLSILLDRGQVKTVEPNIGVVRRPVRIAEALGGDADEIVEADGDSPPEPDLQATSDALNDTAKVAQEVPLTDIVDQEMKASGRVDRWTMIQYMGYFGNPLFAISCIVGLFLVNIFYFGTNFLLSIWVEAYNHDEHVNVVYFLAIFSAFIFLELISYGFIVIVFEWGGWRAARRLHNDFIKAVMSVPLSWFKAIPIGRITNRFSGDMSSIDGMLSSMLRSTIDIFMMIFFRLGAVSSIMPVFMIPGLVTCFIGAIIGEMYTRTAVVIKRLTSSAQSPVFSQFADTLAGLSIIRARKGKAQEFGFELADKLRVWSAASEANYNCNRWVAIRVDFVTSLVALFAGIIAISKVGVVSGGIGWFLLDQCERPQSDRSLLGASYERPRGRDAKCTLRPLCPRPLNTNDRVQFHRVKEYVKLEPEGQDDKPFADERECHFSDDPTRVIPANWPRSGEIEFRDVTIRYDPDGPDILTNINLKFKAGERVAVVGRTGSGKSTVGHDLCLLSLEFHL